MPRRIVMARLIRRDDDDGSFDREFWRKVGHEARFRRYCAAQTHHARMAARGFQPWGINPVMGSCGTKVPQMRIAVTWQQRKPAHFIPRPLADRGAGYVTNIVVVEGQQCTKIRLLQGHP